MVEVQHERRADLRRQVRVLAVAATVTATVLLVALVIAGVVVVHAAGDLVSMGPPPSAGARHEIEHANCKHLIELEYRYIPNGDSVNPDMTELRLTRERIAAFRCPLPPDLRPS